MKPLGSVMGLRFGPSKPAYTAFTLGPATPDPEPGISSQNSRERPCCSSGLRMVGFSIVQLLALIFIVVLGGAGIYLLRPKAAS